ncbi:MAG: phosphomannomutase/phosphoglucomutase [Nocardioides sp.]|uniref:phosphomannomutase/phosphoglucomutase n=1 Tax=Nocardioides sp. TaxID=35761 RepID=UPI0039E69915
MEPERVRAVVKGYDIRGRVPTDWDEPMAHAFGAAFAEVVGEPGAGGESRIVLGHDMRSSSPGLARAFADGARSRGTDVVWIGLASTDELYFASGHLHLPGAMITASHNPAGENGIKLCRPGAVPLGRSTGLTELRDLVIAGPPAPVRPERLGRLEVTDVLAAYAAHLIELAPVSGRRLRVVADAGNGMAGHTAPAVFERLPQIELDRLYFELDGTFPHHVANPLDPTTLRDLQARVLATGADVGLAFDGDADRCFLVDERGQRVDPAAVIGLIAERVLAREPGARIIHNLITSRAVPQIVTELGGVPVRTPVGHSVIKARMAEVDAAFGGEHSGHFYFREFWRADSGMLAALHVLAALCATDLPLSRLMAGYQRFVSSGEINATVADAEAVLARVEAAARAGEVSDEELSIDHLDGLTVGTPAWWFNVRASQTEPLLRLNVEAREAATMERVRDEVLALIRKDTR